MSNIEQTLSIIKPDAVDRNLDNEIKEIFKNKGFTILKEKKIQIDKSEAEKFYKVHETKPFYNDLCSYLSSLSSTASHFGKLSGRWVGRCLISAATTSTASLMMLTSRPKPGRACHQLVTIFSTQDRI